MRGHKHSIRISYLWPCVKSGSLIVHVIKFYWNPRMLICLCIILATFTLRWQNWVSATETLQTTKCWVFTSWSYTEKNLLNPALSLAHALLLLRLNWLFFWSPVVFIFWPRHSTLLIHYHVGFPGDSVVKNPPANTGNAGSIPELGRSPGGGNGNPLQYSCLGNPMDRGPLWAAVQGVAKSWIQLSD